MSKMTKYITSLALIGAMFVAGVMISTRSLMLVEPVVTVAEAGRASAVHIINPLGRGSGVFIGERKILTAGHVCTRMTVAATKIVTTNLKKVYKINKIVLSDRYPVVDLCYMVLTEDPEDVVAMPISDKPAYLTQQVYLASYSGGVAYSFRTGTVLSDEGVVRKEYVQNVTISSIYADPGASGGPVFNSELKLVGVLILKFYEPEASGFVPLHEVTEFLAKQ